MGNLDDYIKKGKKVSELISRKPNIFTEEEKERHRIYAHLLFGITASYFNGSKYGNDSTYPLGAKKNMTDSYYGHNIAAIAVSNKGEVIDFEFNHNKVFDSSVEHAESRLIRRIFSLSQVYNSWDEKKEGEKKYSNQLSEVTVYTTLESCTQCTGIMTLGDVKNVVYLQRDPGMYYIGNIVKNLTEGQGYIEAPLPISGAEIGFDAFEKINSAYKSFAEGQDSKTQDPFVIFPDNKPRHTSSITSFLATKFAFNIFEESRQTLKKLTLNYPDFKPDDKSITNSQALTECLNFFEYASTKGERATPHRM